ncbi:YbhB/YbcL family Raf kinase inhibitor-like protein [Tistrella bauzanensis]
MAWTDPPAGTRGFMLVMEDPDAPSGTFVHWVLHGIDGSRRDLPEGVGPDQRDLAAGQGVNGFGNLHYDGPQPPRGHGPHHYHIRLLALDVDRLDIAEQATLDEIRVAARPHALGTAELIGVYELC